MEKLLSFILLGIVIYGGVFQLTLKQTQEPSFGVYEARVAFEQKPQLGFLDGIHNGFALPGNVVRGFLNKLFTGLVPFSLHWFTTPPPYVPWWLLIVYWICVFVVALVLGMVLFCLYLVLYLALLFKLFFVAASPLYHVGYLIGLGVTWCLIAAAGAAGGQQGGEAAG